jgi:hypothetical protein
VARVRSLMIVISRNTYPGLACAVGLATSFLGASKEEWSLVRRHPSERTFGVQLAGSKPATLVPAAEMIGRECGTTGLDFVDLNCGCPIDLVFKAGSGSACERTSTYLIYYKLTNSLGQCWSLQVACQRA